jgi:endo-1,4-beta-D-glucanase Y
LNPSYSVFPVLARFAEAQPGGPWSDMAANALRLVEAQCPQGFVPDWAVYHALGGLQADPQLGSTGSYDAIRVYLWAGMLDPGHRARGRLLHSLGGMARSLRRSGSVPERVQTLSGKVSGAAPAGFYAALLPYLGALDEPVLQGRVTALLDPHKGPLRDGAERPWGYYDHVLALFGLGHFEGRFRFSSEGRLIRRVS